MLESICVCAFFLCSYVSTLSNPSGDSQLQAQRPQQQWLPEASATNHVQLFNIPKFVSQDKRTNATLEMFGQK
jgi:hypothetical protein